MTLKDIKELRKEIDELDRSIVELLNKRAGLAVEIGSLKSQSGKEVYDPKREAEVIEKLKKANSLLPEASLLSIFREVISASRSLEKRDAIAYLGPEGTFTHEAALSVFGSSVEFLPSPDFESVFGEVENGNADYGVIPVENSIEGSVNLSLDLLAASSLYICAEKTIAANQNLLSNCKNIKEIKKLYSHTQPLGQCRKFLNKNLPGVEIKEAASTAAAAKLAAKGKNSAALASLTAGRIYGLRVVKKSVQDFANNMTRFVVLSKRPAPNPDGSVKTKTSIAITLKNEPGELFSLLGHFEGGKINLTKIVSRPIPGSNWGYLFYIDFEGHRDDPAITGVLEKLTAMSQSLKILGSYPMEPAKSS
jgi:chorismate mutase/prephenate dehydratase